MFFYFRRRGLAGIVLERVRFFLFNFGRFRRFYFFLKFILFFFTLVWLELFRILFRGRRFRFFRLGFGLGGREKDDIWIYKVCFSFFGKTEK